MAEYEKAEFIELIKSMNNIDVIKKEDIYLIVDEIKRSGAS